MFEFVSLASAAVMVMLGLAFVARAFDDRDGRRV